MKHLFDQTTLPTGAGPLIQWIGLSPASLWIVDVPRQRMGVWESGVFDRWLPVSTSAKGLGNRPNSGTTPLGLHRVERVIGRGAAAGQRFVSREPVGKPVTDWRCGEDDMILSRVLPLRGMVAGLNEHSLTRHIYLHGTNREDRLGSPASQGCVRLANRDLIALADKVNEEMPWVWIGSFGSSTLSKGK